MPRPAGYARSMRPCTCGHHDFEHDEDDGSCRTCGCAAYVAEGSNCEPVTADYTGEA